MASEYLKYLNRDVKPEGPPPELTPKEKRRNWWYYHWKRVAVVCIIVLAGVSMLLHNLGITEPIPDYQIAYVGSTRLPDETVEALTDFFQERGEDASGDGKVTVILTQYVFYKDTDAYDYAQLTLSASAALDSDIATQTSYFFLMDNPAGVAGDYQLLADAEGNLPPEGDHSWEDRVVPLSDVMENVPSEASGLYLGRRGFYDESHTVKYKEACDALLGDDCRREDTVRAWNTWFVVYCRGEGFILVDKNSGTYFPALYCAGQECSGIFCFDMFQVSEARVPRVSAVRRDS